MLQQQMQAAQKQLMQMQEAVKSLTETNQQLNIALTNKEREQQMEAEKQRRKPTTKRSRYGWKKSKLRIELFQSPNRSAEALAGGGSMSIDEAAAYQRSLNVLHSAFSMG